MAYSRRMGVRHTGAKRLPRHLRNEDLPTDTFTPRTYQVELLDSALKRNTVVCMGSSTGRTFIAVMLIKEMAEDVRKSLSQGGKRSVYLVDNDELISQQCQLIQHPSDLTVGMFTSDSQSWSETEWKSEIERCQVLVMPAAIFLQLLHQDLLPFTSINLLVLDECHLALQEHPYQHIMSLYKSSTSHQEPRVLGLTSNILKEKYSSPENLKNLITSLEETLASTAETSTLVIPERYGVKPSEQVIECPDYEDTTGLNEQMAELLESAIDFLEECNIEITQELDNRDPTQIPKAALIECHNIMTQLGPWCAACLADMFITQIEKIEKQKEFIPMHKKFLKLGASTLRMISKIFDDHFKHADYSLEELLSYSTPKVAKMLECFNKYRPETDFIIISEEIDTYKSGSDTEMSDDDDSDFSVSGDEDDGRNKSPSSKQIHVAVKKVSPENNKPLDPFASDEDKFLSGIIFVEHQHEAYALNKFIEEVCAWEEQLCFIKSSHITGHAVRTAGRRETKLFKKQEETLRKFRMQELNLLVSTSVLEEGVDVPKCNLVMRFDVPKDYRSYSHSKGRARAREAEYIILIEEENFDEFESQLKMYRNIEQVLIGHCKDEEDVSTNQIEDDSGDEILLPYVPTTTEGAPQVTMTTAITLVNRYCAKLPSDAFTHLTPCCSMSEITSKDGVRYCASLRLPINSPVKQNIQGVPMSTRLKAKQAVALKMCEILHKKGELDDSLMPVGKEMFQHEEDDVEWEEEDDVLGEARPGTTKRKQYYAKKIASALLQSHPVPDISCNLYLFNMKLTGAITDDQNTRGRKIYAPEETPRGFGLLTTKDIPMVPLFPVYTRSGEVSVSVDILQSDLVFSADQLERLKVIHRYLFASVLRLEKDPMDFIPDEAVVGYLVVPVHRKDDEQPVIDWSFIDKVEESIISEKTGKPVLCEEEQFIFKQEEYEDAVVMPSYRNIDQPQHFYVAEIRYDLNPLSSFPSPELYKTFCAYYTTKYGLAITNMEQPLLDVDHTSARLNLLIPRYMNQKGVALPTSSAETKKARRENLQQKQILVPELCDVHVFPASLWRKAVCMPAILYRMNYLLLAEEIRKHIASETNIGIVELPKDFRFPQLDFGFDTSPENLKSSNSSEEQDKDVSFSESENLKDQSENAEEPEENIEKSETKHSAKLAPEVEISEELACGKSVLKNSQESTCGSSEVKNSEGLACGKSELKNSQESTCGSSEVKNSENLTCRKSEAKISEECGTSGTNNSEDFGCKTHCSEISGSEFNSNDANENDQINICSNQNMKNKKSCEQLESNSVNSKSDNAIEKGCKLESNKEFAQVNSQYIPSAGTTGSLVNSCNILDEIANKEICESGEKEQESETLNGHLELENGPSHNVCDKEHVNLTCQPNNSTKTFLSKDKLLSDLGCSALNKEKLQLYQNCQNSNALFHAKNNENKVSVLNSHKEKQCICVEQGHCSLVNGVAIEDETKDFLKEPVCLQDSFTNNVDGSDSLKEDRKTELENDSSSSRTDVNDLLDPDAHEISSKTTSDILVDDLAADLKDLNVEVTVLNKDKSNVSSWGEIDDSHHTDIGYWKSENETHNTAEIKGQTDNVREEPNGSVETENASKDIQKREREEMKDTCETENASKDIQMSEIKDLSTDDKDSGARATSPEPKEDIFQNVNFFKTEESSDLENEQEDLDIFPEPLISLDEDTDLTTYIGPSPCFILQAFTMSNANDFFSLERLETIGDSFLKYAITVYLYCSYSGIHEGKLSYLRSKQVSNYNLYRLGKRKGLAECMISTKFEPYENWLPPGFVVNEDKRKGPVPKVLVAQKVNYKSSSAIFSAKNSEEMSDSKMNADTVLLSRVSEIQKFNKELEAAVQISQAEELEKGDKSDNQQVLTPYSLQVHHSIPDKSIADCVEALIGCYLTSCGKMAALRFMSWMGLKVLPRKEIDISSNMEDLEVEFEKLPCPQSPLLTVSENAHSLLVRQLDGYSKFEERIGYTFQDRSYLLQAFTHASYHYNTVTDCYQRLEFLGDAILDYVITRHLYEDSDKYSPGVLTDLRSALVNNNIFAALAVKWDFHKYFKAISPVLFSVIEKFVARQKEKEDEIDLEDEEADEEHDKEHVELEVPKALGDIFESVAGAIYLDSGMSLDVVWRVFYRIMKPQIDKYLKSIPKSPVRELLEQEPETAKFEKPERTMDGKIRVTVNVVGKGVFSGVGRNYRIAKSAAAKKALRCIKTLEQQGLI